VAVVVVADVKGESEYQFERRQFDTRWMCRSSIRVIWFGLAVSCGWHWPVSFIYYLRPERKKRAATPATRAALSNACHCVIWAECHSS